MEVTTSGCTLLFYRLYRTQQTELVIQPTNELGYRAIFCHPVVSMRSYCISNWFQRQQRYGHRSRRLLRSSPVLSTVRPSTATTYLHCVMYIVSHALTGKCFAWLVRHCSWYVKVSTSVQTLVDCWRPSSWLTVWTATQCTPLNCAIMKFFHPLFYLLRFSTRDAFDSGLYSHSNPRCLSSSLSGSLSDVNCGYGCGQIREVDGCGGRRS